MQNAKVKEDLRVIERGFDPQGAIDQVPRLRKKFKEVFLSKIQTIPKNMLIVV